MTITSSHKLNQKLQTLEGGDLVISTPERKLWAHALLRAYLDFYEFQKDLNRLKNQQEPTFHTKKHYRDCKTNANRRLRRLIRWIESDKIFVGSFMWICQVISTDDGTGIAKLMRKSLTKPRKDVYSGHKYGARSTYRK